jgi:hypothetical protein
LNFKIYYQCKTVIFKPRIFISSTNYTLKHVRYSLEKFISTIKYETVLFEKGDMPFQHDKALEEPCYAEINNCHLLVLIIGGRYGSLSSEIEILGDKIIDGTQEIQKSVTQKKITNRR